MIDRTAQFGSAIGSRGRNRGMVSLWFVSEEATKQ